MKKSRDLQMTYMSSILTVRLTKEAQGILAKRSKRAGMKKGDLRSEADP